MSYDIPDEIKYREKIVFGLDLKQLGYAIVFVLLAFFSFNLPLEGEARFILPAIFSITGAAFIFLNLEEKVSDIWHFYGGVRKAGNFEPQAQRLMGVRAIEKNQIVLMDGSLRAILKVEPINFSLLDEGQKTAFVSNYREFLNHLSTPIQILVRTEKSDAEEIFREQQEKMEGAGLEMAAIFRDFFEFERGFIESKQLRCRKYYLIATQPGRGIADKLAKAEEDACMRLEQRVEIMQEKLNACGLRSERLGTAQLLHFFSTYCAHDYNDDKEGAREGKDGTEKAGEERKQRKHGKKGKSKRRAKG